MHHAAKSLDGFWHIDLSRFAMWTALPSRTTIETPSP